MKNKSKKLTKNIDNSTEKLLLSDVSVRSEQLPHCTQEEHSKKSIFGKQRYCEKCNSFMW